MRVNVGGYYLKTVNDCCKRYNIKPEHAIEAIIDFWEDNADFYDKESYFNEIRREHENDGKESI